MPRGPWFRKVLSVAGVCAASVGCFALNTFAYAKPKLSQFEIAAKNLGFDGSHSPSGSAQEEQDGLLRIFCMAGNLEPERFWISLNRMGGVADPDGEWRH